MPGGAALPALVCAASGVADDYEGVGSADLVEELVSQTLSLVGTSDKTGGVDEVNRDEAGSVDASAVVRLVLYVELGVDTGCAEVADSPVRLYRCEWEVGYLDGFECGGGEERALADVCLAYESYEGRHVYRAILRVWL